MSSDQKYLLSGGDEHVFRIWDFATGTLAYESPVLLHDTRVFHFGDTLFLGGYAIYRWRLPRKIQWIG